jgi:hypothetical protein
MLRTLVSLVLLLLIGGAGAFEAAPRAGTFSLGVLRRDGILVPFAAFDGKHWENPWPTPSSPPDMPLSVSAIPKGWWFDKQPITDWTLLPLGAPSTGNGTRTVRVNGINWYPAECNSGVGLRTDYKPAILPPSPRIHPYPKDALAISGDVKIDPIEMVDPKDRVAFNLNEELPFQVNGKEKEMVDHFSGRSWRHSYNVAEREKIPVTLEALYRVRKAFDGRDLYYFEAVKRYFLPKESETARQERAQMERMASLMHKAVPKEEPHCDLITFAKGWFTTETPDGKIRDLNPQVTVTSCDYHRVSFMLPMGSVQIGDKREWIVQWSATSEESYMVMAPGNNRTNNMEIEFVTNGGSCPESEENDQQ